MPRRGGGAPARARPAKRHPNADQDIYRQVAEEVKRHCDIVLCTTTGAAWRTGGEPG